MTKIRIPPTVLLASSALLSRLLGLFRDHLLASTFGASTGHGIYNLDIYYAAFRIPDLLYNLLIFGAISASFIPIFTQYQASGQKQKAWEFSSNMMHLLLIFILIISGIVYLFTPQFAHLVAAGFKGEDFDLTVRLMRIMLLSPIIFTISAIFISLQDSFKTFFYRSLSPIFYNLGIIVGILFFSRNLGVVGVTWGVIIGALLQLLIQLPALRKIGYRHLWILDAKRADVQKAFKLLIPRMLGLSLYQITLVLNTLMASFLATGSITILYLADNLQAVPLGIIGISFSITSFATLSELAMQDSHLPFIKEVDRVAHKILFLIIPATLGMIFLRSRIIDVILRAGKFTASDAHTLETVLVFLLISLFAQCLIPLFCRGFYAHHNTKIPVWSAILDAVVSTGGAYLLAFWLKWGVEGIAIAFSLGTVLDFILLYFLMRKKFKEPIIDFQKTLKMILAGVFMYGCLYFFDGFIHYGTRLMDRLGSLAFLILIGMVSYFLAAKLLKIPEIKMLSRS